MATEVIMPALGMAQDTGTILRWLRGEGDEVRKGEPLMEVETDKVTVEVEAPADGTLAGLRAGEGEAVPVGEAVAVVLAAGEEAPAPAAAEPVAAPDTVAAAAAPAAPDRDAPRRRPLASPKARRLAARLGVDLARVRGSGPHGAVVAADVEGFGDGNGGVAAPAAALAAGEEVAVGPGWRRMAERMGESWRSAPHFSLVRDVDAVGLNAWRDGARLRGGRITHTDLLVKLCAASLQRHPRVNARFEDGCIVAAEAVNVGIAVATDDGLIVPVVHGADALGVAAIAERRAELVAAAREGRLRPDDVAGGTFTISNLGMYGVDAFTAVVNPPQAAILAVGRIADRVVPVAGAPAVRPTVTFCLSFDHRVVDGARGAQFLDTLAGLAEDPLGLMD